MDDLVSFGSWLRQRRKALDLTQAALATRVGVATSTIEKFEAEVRRPSQQTAARLAVVLAITAAEQPAFVGWARGERRADPIPPLPAVPLPGVSRRAHDDPLPSALTSFIGRDREMAEAVALLRQPDVRLLTLAGPGGVGKTRLALAVAATLRADFADGVCFVPLAPVLDAALVLPAIAQALHVLESGAQPLLARLHAYLRARQLLLIVDNVEHVIAAAPLLAAVLQAAPQLTLLVTSREVLQLSGEHLFAVPPLTLPRRDQDLSVAAIISSPAGALFVARAKAVQPALPLTDATAAAVAEICERLDGLPLAIELAAARCRVLSPLALLERLGDPLTLLTGGARDLPPRQQTMRATLDWSYHLLDAAAQRLLARVSVFVGGCTLDAVEAVMGDEGGVATVLDGIEALVQHSLLRCTHDRDLPMRYALHEVVRQYAAERLRAAGEAERTRTAHLRYYLDLAEEAAAKLTSSEQHHWLAYVAAEHDNVRAALGWSTQDAARTGMSVRLAVAMWRFWVIRGHVREGRQWLVDVLRSVGTTRVPETLHAQALHAAGMLALAQDDMRQAHALLEHSLALHRGLHDQQGMGEALTGLALSDGQRALALHTEALALRRQQGDRRATAESLQHLGRLAFEGGEDVRAVAQYEEALALCREVRDTLGIANALAGVSEVLAGQGEYAQAERLREESLAVCRELGDTLGSAWSLFNLGRIALCQGDVARATRVCEESLALFRDIGNRWGIAWVGHTLGTLAQLQQAHEAAREWFAHSLRLFRERGDPSGIAACLEGLAENAADQVQPGKRAEGLQRAARLYAAAATLRAALGTEQPSVLRTRYDARLAAVRTELGDQPFVAAWAAGAAISVERAIADAFADGEDSSHQWTMP